MTKEDKIKEKDQLISEIKKYAPILRHLYDLDTNLIDYAKEIYNFKADKEQIKRQNLIRNVINNKLKSLYGENYSKELNVNLKGNLAFNIADHHQILNHPLLISANVISSAHKFLQNKKPEAIIVISSGDVPPNNYFSLNGFTFHDKKVPIFSNSEREFTSYFIPKRDFDFVGRLKKADRWKEFNQQEKDFLIKECEKIKSYDFSKCKDYSDQITVIVKNQWPYLFEEKLCKNLPELIYLTQEEITKGCLLELLKDENNIISRCLFDVGFRDRIFENFRGNVVTWNEKEMKGTHFFWLKYPDRPQSLRLYFEDGKLVPTDERFKHLAFALEKDVILDKLEKNEIYPSLFTIFAVLNFWAGIRPLVGLGSMTYLNLMKESWIKTFKEFNLQQELKLIEKVDVNGIVATLAIFFKRINDEQLKTLYAYDLIYEGGVTEEYLKTILSMGFNNFFTVSARDTYYYYSQKYIPKEKWLNPKITFDDLAGLIFDWL